MRKLNLNSIIVLLTSILLFASCEESFYNDKSDQSILPEKFSVDIPSAISKDIASKKSVAIDTMEGNHVYQHLTFFIRAGESAAEIVESIIRSIRVYDIDRIKTLSYESDEDGRIKNLEVYASPEFDDRVWDYGLTLTDSESESESDGGKGLQIFWNENPRAGVAILKPYNINRKDDSELGEAMFRIDYSEENDMGYEASMMVSIADLPSIDPLLEPFAMNSMKMMVGKNGNFVDVFGNSSHPNAKLLTTTTGYNWAFVASAEENLDVAVAEVGLPLNTLDESDRQVILVENSIKNVFTNEVLTVWPHASTDIIESWLVNTEAPGFFDTNGFVQGGTAPNADYSELESRISMLKPYNPSNVTNIEIEFN